MTRSVYFLLTTTFTSVYLMLQQPHIIKLIIITILTIQIIQIQLIIILSILQLKSVQSAITGKSQLNLTQ